MLMINEELLLYMPNFGLTRYGLSHVPDKFTFGFGHCGYIDFFFFPDHVAWIIYWAWDARKPTFSVEVCIPNPIINSYQVPCSFIYCALM